MTNMPDDDTPPPNPRKSPVDLADLQFNYGIAQSGFPVLVFLVANNIASTQVALVLALVTAVAVVIRNRQSGVIRLLSILAFVITAAAAVTGLVLDSEKAFAAQNIVSDLSIVVAGGVSLLVGRPILGLIARELVPGLRPILPVADRVFVALTVGFILLNLFQAAFRIYMIETMSTNAYIVISRVVAIPLNLGFFGLAWYMLAKRVQETSPHPPRTIEGEALP